MSVPRTTISPEHLSERLHAGLTEPVLRQQPPALHPEPVHHQERLAQLAIPVTKQARRQASRAWLDETIKTRAGKLIRDHRMNPEGRDLDTKRLGHSNWVIVKAAIDKKANRAVGRGPKERSEFSQAEIDLITERLDSIVAEFEGEVLGG